MRCVEWKRQRARLPIQQKIFDDAKKVIKDKHTEHRPQSWDAEIAPNTVDLAFIVQAPYRLASVSDLLPTDAANMANRIAQSDKESEGLITAADQPLPTL